MPMWLADEDMCPYCPYCGALSDEPHQPDCPLAEPEQLDSPFDTDQPQEDTTLDDNVNNTCAGDIPGS